ncbi:MAG: hypothetical protein GXO90_03990 [FCB group bacterium]|nr:hypothetical protein [FCB group bacterium]
MNKNTLFFGLSTLVVGLLMVAFSFDWGGTSSSAGNQVTVRPSTAAPEPRGNMGDNPSATMTAPVFRGNVGNLNADIPDSWTQEKPSSAMRLTQFDLPALAGDRENAQLIVFNQIGGSIDQNLNRWYGQFKQPDGSSSASKARRETFTANGLPVTMVSLKGTFSASSMGMGGAPTDKPDYGLLGAIVSSPEGPYYFKLVGPAATIDGYRAAFESFLKSMRYMDN